MIRFIEHLQIVTTCNYISVANSHTLQFTTAIIKPSESSATSLVDVHLLQGSRPRKLAAMSHQPSTILTAVPRLSDPRYAASARTAQWTLLPIALLLLQACLFRPLPNNSHFYTAVT
jgi:hypothetical protein